MKKILLLALTIFTLYGCSESTSKSELEVIIDATQFSGLSSAELIAIMDEPQLIEGYEWEIPSSGQNIIGELYIYDNNKFEFLLFDGKVVRSNVYSGVYWGYDDTTFSFNSGEEVLKTFGILNTYKNMARTVNTGVVEKYEPVTEGIQVVEIHDIKEDTFGLIRFTYDNSYYN